MDWKTKNEKEVGYRNGYAGEEGNGGSDFRGAEKEKKEDGWQRKLPRTPIKVGGS